jgi:hypothetical protein
VPENHRRYVQLKPIISLLTSPRHPDFVRIL